MRKVTIYTDGACSGNPGPGGWGSILIYKNIEKVISGYDEYTTNNKMELTAAIKALQALKEPCDVSLYTDSSYLCNAFNNGWIYNWLKNNWKTSQKKPVENMELWKALYNLNNYHKINFIKVKGHSDNTYNNRCDKLATDEIKKYSK